MLYKAWPAVIFLCLILAAAAPVAGQNPVSSAIEDFEIITGVTRVDVPLGDFATIPFTFRDLSRDGTGTVTPGGPGAFQHVTTLSADPIVPLAGWTVSTSSTAIHSFAGETRELFVQIGVEPTATEPFFEANISARFVGVSGEAKIQSFTIVGYSPGLAAFSAQSSDNFLIKPGQIIEAPITIRNTALTPRVFDIRVTDNPCGMLFATSSGNVVQPRSLDRFPISLRAPSDKIWYSYESCQVTVQVTAQDNPNQARTAIINIQVTGFYVNPVWVFWTVGITLAAVLLYLVAKRRKEQIEEEILGKPQKPWTIPVEAVYLTALRKKDERAWYVVRHHIMEEEYRSALLWYSSYKAATKGTRKKESLVLSQEKAYNSWVKKWQKIIRRPLRKADRFEAALQRKLDRKAKKSHRRQLSKYRKVMRKLEASHAAQVERALEAWEKASRKATKKGLAAPQRPTIPEPDYPGEPEPEPLLLADHRWARKAARYRARRVREQGNLEVKFEKADAKHLAQLRKTVQKLGRKLDDPDFIAAHPMLQQDDGAKKAKGRKST